MSSELELFPESAAYRGSALFPDLDNPTPASIVATLTRPQREQRVERLMEQARGICSSGIAEHSEGKEVIAKCILFSGGNDSTILAHLFKSSADYAVHANTTIGIEQTRQFVRDTCSAWDLSLIEKVAPTSYRELVLDRGFPGPAMHYKMYQRLKERCLDAVRRDLVTNGRSQRVVFIAGRRRQESERRANIPLHERNGSIIWVSPLAMWTKLDMNTYRLMHGNVPINEVSDLIHMSGECLCGSFAKPGELDELRLWFPEIGEEIDQLERDVTAAGFEAPFNKWGHGKGAPSKSGAMCSSCAGQFELDLGGNPL